MAAWVAPSVEQFRLTSVGLQMVPMSAAVHIQFPVYLAVVKEGKKLSDFDFLISTAKDMLDQLAWWAKALKAARENAEGTLRVA
jgi:hypothetical protein